MFHKSQVFQTVHDFFTYYFSDRNLEKTLSLLSEHVYSIGTGEEEVACGRDAFQKLLESELSAIPEPICFEIKNYTEKQRMKDCWDCFFNMTVVVTMPDGILVQYHMRNTMGLHVEDGKCIIDVMHASEASAHQEEGEFFPFKLISDHLDAVNEKTKSDIMEIIREFIPGGVVGGYEEKGFPLYAANEQLLKMAGYSSYSEFDEDIQGLIINSIHPEDQAYVECALKYSFEYRDYYEIQYRMKKKDGTYFWVYDIGKRTKDSNGRNAIISVIIDISDQMMKRKQMEKELSRDSLTGLYNRKSGEKRIKNALNDSKEYLFFMLDLDNFKRVNDIYGHAQGDEVLRMFAEQASKCFRKEDTICRMGGDEFVVFVNDTCDIEAISKKMNTLIDVYKQIMDKKWPDAKSTLSAGGVCANKFYDFKELYKMADEVLYEVKKSKKGILKLLVLGETENKE